MICTLGPCTPYSLHLTVSASARSWLGLHVTSVNEGDTLINCNNCLKYNICVIWIHIRRETLVQVEWLRSSSTSHIVVLHRNLHALIHLINIICTRVLEFVLLIVQVVSKNIKKVLLSELNLTKTDLKLNGNSSIRCRLKNHSRSLRSMPAIYLS